jgi:hypothetical protein
MKSVTSASWHFVAARRNPDGARLAWDGEVPFIRQVSLDDGVQFNLRTRGFTRRQAVQFSTDISHSP